MQNGIGVDHILVHVHSSLSDALSDKRKGIFEKEILPLK